MNLERKQELLLKWKESGLSLPKWWRENADELGLPHLSTLYTWVKDAGFSTEPGVKENKEPEEHDENPGETDDSGDSPEADETGEEEESQGLTEIEISDEPEEKDVIAKDRIEQLTPSTVPEPAQTEKPVDEPKTGIKIQTLFIVGGAVVLGIGAYLMVRKLIKRKEPKQEQNNTPGGNPFGGYITIDEF